MRASQRQKAVSEEHLSRRVQDTNPDVAPSWGPEVVGGWSHAAFLNPRFVNVCPQGTFVHTAFKAKLEAFAPCLS